MRVSQSYSQSRASSDDEAELVDRKRTQLEKVPGTQWRCVCGRLIDDKLVLMAGLFVWLGVSFGCLSKLGFFDSTFFRFGPSSTMVVAQIPIDTWKKWTLLVTFRVCTTLVEAGTYDIVHPWTITCLQNAQCTRVPYRNWKCYTIQHLCEAYEVVRLLIMVLFMVSQIDMTLLELLSRAFMIQFYSMPRWMRGKKVRRDTRQALTGHSSAASHPQSPKRPGHVRDDAVQLSGVANISVQAEV